MKCIKHSAKESVRRVQTLSSNLDSSFCSNSSTKSYGKWSKRSNNIGPVKRNVHPKIKPSTATPTRSEEVVVVGTQKVAFFDLSKECKEPLLLPGVTFETL